MRIRKVPPSIIVNQMITATKAGLTLEEARLEHFICIFQQYIDKIIDPEDLRFKIMTDGNLEPDQINIQNARLIQEAGPWGQQFPEPSFEGTFIIKNQRLVGENHLKLVLSSELALDINLDAIFFNIDTELWPNDKIDRVQCVYRLDINDFRGQQNLQILLQYMVPCEV